MKGSILLVASFLTGLVIIAAIARIGDCAPVPPGVNMATDPLPRANDELPFVLHCQVDTAQGVKGREIGAESIEQQGDVWILDGAELVGSRVYVQQRGEICTVYER